MRSTASYSVAVEREGGGGTRVGVLTSEDGYGIKVPRGPTERGICYAEFTKILNLCGAE